MSAKRWSANRAVWTQNLRQISWIAIIHWLLWMAAIVLPIALAYSQYDPKVGNVPQWENVYHISNRFETLIAWLVPILAAAGVLRYMHDKRSADFIHSLPIRRTELLTSQIVFGWLMVAVPLLLTALVAIGCLAGLDLPWPINAADVWRWFGETVTVETVIFAFSIAVGVLVGQSVIHVVLTNILLVFPAGILVLIYTNLSLLLPGFPNDYYLSIDVERLVIPLRYEMLGYRSMEAGEAGGCCCWRFSSLASRFGCMSDGRPRQPGRRWRFRRSARCLYTEWRCVHGCLAAFISEEWRAKRVGSCLAT